ncbi:MAG: hypothetical protein L0H23_02275 [Luteimonas sp.]|nr:hypothetical protein [Luteimonas sp.]
MRYPCAAAFGEFDHGRHPVWTDRDAQVLQGEEAAVRMHRGQVDQHVRRFALQPLQQFGAGVIEVLQRPGAYQHVLAVGMLREVGEGKLAAGIVSLCPALARGHHRRQAADRPAQVPGGVEVLAEPVVAHADVAAEVEDMAPSVGEQAGEPEHERIVAGADALHMVAVQAPGGFDVVAGRQLAGRQRIGSRLRRGERRIDPVIVVLRPVGTAEQAPPQRLGHRSQRGQFQRVETTAAEEGADRVRFGLHGGHAWLQL